MPNIAICLFFILFFIVQSVDDCFSRVVSEPIVEKKVHFVKENNNTNNRFQPVAISSQAIIEINSKLKIIKKVEQVKSEKD